MLAAFIGGWHLVWSTLVLVGWAQPVLDFIFWLHVITPLRPHPRRDLERAASDIGSP